MNKIPPCAGGSFLSASSKPAIFFSHFCGLNFCVAGGAPIDHVAIDTIATNETAHCPKDNRVLMGFNFTEDPSGFTPPTAPHDCYRADPAAAVAATQPAT